MMSYCTVMPYGDKRFGPTLDQVMAWCLPARSHYHDQCEHINGLMQERRTPLHLALAMELSLSCINPLILSMGFCSIHLGGNFTGVA